MQQFQLGIKQHLVDAARLICPANSASGRMS